MMTRSELISKNSQIEHQIRSFIQTISAAYQTFTLSDYIKFLGEFINDFDTIEFLGKNIVVQEAVHLSLLRYKVKTRILLEWEFWYDLDVMEESYQIQFKFNFENLYKTFDTHEKKHDVSYEILKIEFDENNPEFASQLKLAVKNLEADRFYKVLKDSEQLIFFIDTNYDM